jgi:hypothetical protein
LQAEALIRVLRALEPEAVAHGDCIGADEEFHLCAQVFAYSAKIHIFPPVNTTKRAYCEGAYFVHEAHDYLTRNGKIVDWAHGLIACPSGPEKLRSGTWATIRRARQKGIPILIIYPDGSEADEPAKEEA